MRVSISKASQKCMRRSRSDRGLSCVLLPEPNLIHRSSLPPFAKSPEPSTKISQLTSLQRCRQSLIHQSQRLAFICNCLGRSQRSRSFWPRLAFTESSLIQSLNGRARLEFALPWARKIVTCWVVLKEALHLTLVGVALGLIGAFAATRVLTSLLFEVKPTDPATFICLSLLLTLVALLAGYIPARRATKVDPLVALRYE